MTTTIQKVPAGTYSLDPIHSSFRFAVKHNGVSTFRGRFDEVEATLSDGVLIGTAQVESVNVPIADLKGHLLSPEFFNAAESPTVTFRSTDIRIEDRSEE
ncbi:MAG: YceI family protein, partial [Solirubrobacteraceae bacterium]